MSAQVKLFLWTVSVGVRVPDRESSCGHGHTVDSAAAPDGIRRHLLQVDSYVEGQAGADCETVGFACVGSNRTPATTCEMAR
jgi:hypothetical protein